MLLLLLVSCFVVFFCFKLLLLPLVVNKDDYYDSRKFDSRKTLSSENFSSKHDYYRDGNYCADLVQNWFNGAFSPIG